jgi:flagellar basal body rod protein FlgG
MKRISLGCAIILSTQGCAFHVSPPRPANPLYVQCEFDNALADQDIGYKKEQTDGRQIWLDLSQGPWERTANPLDVMIQGDGFFQIQLTGALGKGIAFTRNGGFVLNRQGELVLGIGDGYPLIPPIKLPAITDPFIVEICEDGLITLPRVGRSGRIVVGQIRRVTFHDASRLKSLGEGLYAATDQSGPPIDADPKSAVLLQGFLEGSNYKGQKIVWTPTKLKTFCAAVPSRY